MKMALTLSREKYRRFLSSASGGDKPSRLLLYYGGGDKSLCLPLSSVRGGDFADVGGIGIGIMIDQIWFGGLVHSVDGSLDSSIDGGGSDRRGGQIASVGGGRAWWRGCVHPNEESRRAYGFILFSILYSNDGSGAGAVGCLWFMTVGYLVFDGGGGTLSGGGDGFWVESDPLENGADGGGAVMQLAVLERDVGGGSGVEDLRSTVTEVDGGVRSEWAALSPCWADCFWDPCFGLSGLGLTGWALSYGWKWVGWVLSMFKAWSVFGMGVEGDFSLSIPSMNRVSMANTIV